MPPCIPGQLEGDRGGWFSREPGGWVGGTVTGGEQRGKKKQEELPGDKMSQLKGTLERPPSQCSFSRSRNDGGLLKTRKKFKSLDFQLGVCLGNLSLY